MLIAALQERPQCHVEIFLTRLCPAAVPHEGAPVSVSACPSDPAREGNRAVAEAFLTWEVGL